MENQTLPSLTEEQKKEFLEDVTKVNELLSKWVMSKPAQKYCKEEYQARDTRLSILKNSPLADKALLNQTFEELMQLVIFNNCVATVHNTISMARATPTKQEIKEQINERTSQILIPKIDIKFRN